MRLWEDHSVRQSGSHLSLVARKPIRCGDRGIRLSASEIVVAQSLCIPSLTNCEFAHLSVHCIKDLLRTPSLRDVSPYVQLFAGKTGLEIP